MRKPIALAMVALAVACPPASARAELLPEISVRDLVQRSSVVAVVRISSYTQDPDVTSTRDRPDDAFEMLKPRGNYTFDVLHTLKGHASGRLRMHLDTLKAFYTDYARPPLTPGSHALLFLARTPRSALAPTFAGLPVIPISPGSARVLGSGSAQQKTVGVLLASAKDRRYRKSSLYMLSKEGDPRILRAATGYATDPDIHVRDLALYARATNQDLTAIPAILTLEERVHKQYGSCAECISGLRAYRDPRAISVLAPLVISPSQWVRANVSEPVRQLANRSSIPYLLLALHDPEICNAGAAYDALHRVIGTVGPARDLDYFEANKEEECAKLYAWWADELAGKHTCAPRSASAPPAGAKIVPADR